MRRQPLFSLAHREFAKPCVTRQAQSNVDQLWLESKVKTTIRALLNLSPHVAELLKRSLNIIVQQQLG
jgi:hypothetical protein